MVIVIVVIFAVVVAVATRRGGELSAERSDYVPLDLGPVSATDVALLRPPTALWGYSVQATNEAMSQIAESIRERDVRIVALEQLVTDLSRDHAPASPLGSPYVGARHRREQAEPATQVDLYGPPAAFDPAEGSFASAESTFARAEGSVDPAGESAAPAEAAVPATSAASASSASFDPEAPAEPAVPGDRAELEPDPGPWGTAAERVAERRPEEDDPWAAAAEHGPERPPWETVAEQEPARAPWDSGGTQAAEPVRLDVDPGRPGGELSGPPPERSHD
jgi:hypothetical protein